MNTRRVQRRPIVPRRADRVLGLDTREERIARVSWGPARTQIVLFGVASGGTVYQRYMVGVRPKFVEELQIRMTQPHSNFGCGLDVRCGPYNASAQGGWTVGDRVGEVQLVDEFQVYAWQRLVLGRNWAFYVRCVNLTNSTQAVLGHWLYREVEDWTQVVDPLRVGWR